MASSTGRDREFISGSTIVLTAIISQPETRAPLDPQTVTLDGLLRGKESVGLPTDVTFRNETPGQWVLRLDSSGFQPGRYTWRVRASDNSLGVALREDTFVVRAQA